MVPKKVLLCIALGFLSTGLYSQESDYTTICTLTRSLETKKNISQADIDSLITIIRSLGDVCIEPDDTERVPNPYRATDELFSKWFHLALTDWRFARFFLQLSVVDFRNAEFGEEAESYILSLIHKVPKTIITMWHHLDPSLQANLLGELQKQRSTIAHWRALSFQQKHEQFDYYFEMIAVNDEWPYVNDKNVEARLDSIAVRNDKLLRSIQNQLAKKK